MVASLGTTFSKSCIAGFSSLTVGCAARAKGRIWFLIGGMVWRANGRCARWAGASARAPGRSWRSAGPS